MLNCGETGANRPKQDAQGAAVGTKVPAQRLWRVFLSDTRARTVRSVVWQEVNGLPNKPTFGLLKSAGQFKFTSRL